MTEPQPTNRQEPGDDLVPLFGSWRNAYIVVVVVFVIEVALFFVFSRYFS